MVGDGAQHRRQHSTDCHRQSQCDSRCEAYSIWEIILGHYDYNAVRGRNGDSNRQEHYRRDENS